MAWGPVIWLAALTLLVLAADVAWRVLRMPATSLLAVVLVGSAVWLGLVYMARRWVSAR